MQSLSDHTFQCPYDRSAVKAGVVHLGLGAFQRAHQAPIFDRLVAAGDMRWGITGVAMRSPAVVNALMRQDGLYSLLERGEGESSPRVIAALQGLAIAAHDPQSVIAAIAHRDTQLVTLTVTEKGYFEQGETSAAGLIARALDRRRLQGLSPLTIMSCDNRAQNGPVARDAVLAAAVAGGLADSGIDWIAREVAFPSSMVDRITPAPTPEMMADSSTALGLIDRAAVWTEPYWQWVIEDRFAAARPDFAEVGVQLVADVEPWEKAKLRLLNAAHSTLAYLGLLRGHRFVHEAIADPELDALVERLWDEVAVTLDYAVVDVSAYRAALRRRFANSALPHSLEQIAADGSQKLPPRLLATIKDRASRGQQSPALAASVAGWIEALARIDTLGDPLGDALRSLAREGAPAVQMMARIAPEFRHADQIAMALTALRPH